MVAMGHAHSLLGPLAEVVVRNRFWMVWNLILASVPLALAVPVFRHRGPRRVGWWLGLGLLVLFLPNAPYVVTWSTCGATYWRPARTGRWWAACCPLTPPSSPRAS